MCATMEELYEHIGKCEPPLLEHRIFLFLLFMPVLVGLFSFSFLMKLKSANSESAPFDSALARPRVNCSDSGGHYQMKAAL